MQESQEIDKEKEADFDALMQRGLKAIEIIEKAITKRFQEVKT